MSALHWRDVSVACYESGSTPILHTNTHVMYVIQVHVDHYINLNNFTIPSIQGLYWYPQWMGVAPHQPYPIMTNDEKEITFDSPGEKYPHQQGYDMDEQDIE